jgi:hypothetical protein
MAQEEMPMAAPPVRETLSWKDDWPTVRRRYIDFWNRRGVILALSDDVGPIPAREPLVDPGPRESLDRWYTDPGYHARLEHFRLARKRFPADHLPAASIDLGPGSLAVLLGAEPEWDPSTVWYKPLANAASPDAWGKLALDPGSRWWKITEGMARACATLGRGKYLVGFPDLIENIDILASLRDAEELLADMIERPSWVLEKVAEINLAYFDVYGRIYEIIKDADGGSSFPCFNLWGPGKVGKVQCDASAMFSPAMFNKFVVPSLEEQCAWLDHSLYHLDGSQAVCHLDALLGIDALDAIEWTPEPGQPKGGSPAWYEMYRRILSAGKCVQVLDPKPEEVAPLLDAIGADGVFLLAWAVSERDRETYERAVERYR